MCRALGARVAPRAPRAARFARRGPAPRGAVERVDVALKEWALVVDALRRGEQIALARKGGLRDARGTFEARADAFWLFPTAFHANERWDVPATDAATGAATKALDALAVRAATFEVRAEDAPMALKALSRRSGWPEDLFARRANWKPDAPLVILVVRCYEARPGLTIDAADDERFGGCKSWVDTDAWVFDASALRACVSDEEFEAMSRSLREDLFAIGATQTS